MLNVEQAPQLIIDGIAYFGVHTTTDSWLYLAAVFSIVLFIGLVSFVVCHYLLGPQLTRFITASKAKWDDELHQHGFFRRLAHLAPAVIIYLLTPLLLPDSETLVMFVQKSMFIYIMLVAVAAGSALLSTLEDIYNTSRMARHAPITGFVQVAKLVLVIVAILLIIANLIDKSPLILLSGLGAVTAILALVFKDTLLGFVAGIQIAANRMVNTGDWIEMPSYGADGNVLEVGLTTVKVQNWDKTISTIPTYALISDSVKNWRGMSESSGRRIKRAVNIDIKSIRFLDEQDLQSFSQIRFIKEYVAKKKQALAEYHQQANISTEDLLNSRRLTNLGTLRAYMEAYLRNHPKINQELTLMVRQLPPTSSGVPLEVYCFSAVKDWVSYEGIQADIFDHILAMLPIFGLRAYQHISDQVDNRIMTGSSSDN